MLAQSDGRPVGWLKVVKLPPKTDDGLKPGKVESDYVDWDSRFVLSPVPPEPGLSFTVYEDRELKAPLMELVAVADKHLALAPILKKEGKDKDPVYKVLCYTGKAKSSQTGPTSIAGSAPTQIKETKLEVVFVIDTTGSMGPFIEGTKKIVEECAKKLAESPKLKGLVRFGLIEFRDPSANDYPPGGNGKFAARVASPLTEDFKALSHAIGELKAEGGGDLPEDVLAGLMLAVTGGKDGKEVGWSENSSKHIILLGDASHHLSGPGNSTNMSIEGVIKEAKKTAGSQLEQVLGSKCLHAVHIINPNETKDDKEDNVLCAKHFALIAQNNGGSQGVYMDTDPTKPEDKNKCVNEMTDFLVKGVGNIRALRDKDVGAIERDARTSPIAKECYKILKSSGGEPTPTNVGHATETAKSGDRVSQVKVMVTLTELEELRSTLNYVRTKFGGNVDRVDIKKTLKMLRDAAVGVAGGEQLTPDDQLQNLITDLPLQPGVLSETAVSIGKMNADQFKEWLKKLKESETRAEQLIRKGDWMEVADYSNRDKAATKEQYLFLLEREMP